jgi:hypothetical protein
MKYLKKYKVFELSENDESKVIDDLIDIFSDISDYGLEVKVESVPRKLDYIPDYDETNVILGDSINVSIHGIVGDDNLIDFSLPTFKIEYVTDVIQRANDFLKSYSYIIQPIFATKITTGGGKQKNESYFITLDDIESKSNMECTHVSINWRLPIDYKFQSSE